MEPNEQKIALLSDTVLYREAVEFARGRPMPDGKQLTGLATFSRNWDELSRYVRNQVERDWVNRPEYQQFYTDLRRYLSDPKTGLRRRGKDEFLLVPDGLSSNNERAALDGVAQRLAQEFIQHLIAEARLLISS